MKLAALPLVCLLVAPIPAQAMRCTEWKDMSQHPRIGAVQREFMEMLRRDWPRPYRAAGAGRVEQCLGDASPAIRRDFDAACAEGRAGAWALDEILRGHIERCAMPGAQSTSRKRSAS